MILALSDCTSHCGILRALHDLNNNTSPYRSVVFPLCVSKVACYHGEVGKGRGKQRKKTEETQALALAAAVEVERIALAGVTPAEIPDGYARIPTKKPCMAEISM